MGGYHFTHNHFTPDHITPDHFTPVPPHSRPFRSRPCHSSTISLRYHFAVNKLRGGPNTKKTARTKNTQKKQKNRKNTRKPTQTTNDQRQLRTVPQRILAKGPKQPKTRAYSIKKQKRAHTQNTQKATTRKRWLNPPTTAHKKKPTNTQKNTEN